MNHFDNKPPKRQALGALPSTALPPAVGDSMARECARTSSH